MTTSIQIEHLSKRFRISNDSWGYNTLRDRIAGLFSSKRRTKEAEHEFWALRDVSFDVREGEAVGLLGANGAGKSTLLKILSRITEPSGGIARLRGRVASLLEVGTGFHPELTGRENIFLNGTILGMTRAEIRSRFDDIVAFAEVERFIDTPVKRYSSGMYVRLAFAVAAHLTPEILLVDEVLAVGDYQFQKKCLGRMGEVARSGRTVVFVSHNLASIEDLCDRSVLLKRGRVEKIGSSTEVIAHYLSSMEGQSKWDFDAISEREGTGRATIQRARLLDEAGEPTATVEFHRPFTLRLDLFANEGIERPVVGVALLSERNERVFVATNVEGGNEPELLKGACTIDVTFEDPSILPGPYFLELWVIDVPGVSFADHLRMVGRIDVVVGGWSGPNVAELSYHDRGRVYVRSTWSFSKTDK
jgi:lipopolysaccharide transport system ATP-binding protein